MFSVKHGWEKVGIEEFYEKPAPLRVSVEALDEGVDSDEASVLE
jgi:hypothetical protein